MLVNRFPSGKNRLLSVGVLLFLIRERLAGRHFSLIFFVFCLRKTYLIKAWFRIPRHGEEENSKQEAPARAGTPPGCSLMT
jgi:hypothetical protein